MGRSPCCVKEGLNRGTWTALEDQILIDYINTHGEGRWRRIPKEAGLKRCGKSCRLRWLNYLRPGIKRGNITQEEEDLIIRLHKLLGNRWSLIAGRIPGRTDNEIKNYWNTTLGKKVNNGQDDVVENKNENKKKKKTKTKTKTKSLTRVLDSIPAVRTKAMRCNSVAVTSHLQPLPLVETVHGVALDEGIKISEEDNATSTTTSTTTTTSTSDDFVLYFDVGKLFNVSENIPDSSDDYWELCQFGGGDKGLEEEQYGGDINNGGGGSNNYKLSSSASCEPTLFSEEMLKEWMKEDCFHHLQS